MVIKSIRIRTRSRGPEALLAHLRHGDENEHVWVLRGTDQDLRDAADDARRHARVFALRHFVIAPAEATTTAQMLVVVDDLAREFGFDAAAAFIVEHVKPRVTTDAFPGHLHVVVAEVDPVTGGVLSSTHDYARQERVAREAEHILGHRLVHGGHHRAVVAALRKAGKDAVADALDAAFPDGGQPPRAAFSHADQQKAARRGVDLPVARLAIAEAWRMTTTKAAFVTAIGSHGLTVSPGDKPGTWVVAAADGTFVGSLARLARLRKIDVLARMEKADVHPHEDRHHLDRQARNAPHDDGGGDLQDKQSDPCAPGAASHPRGASPGIGHGGRPDRPPSPNDASPRGGPGALKGGSGCHPRQDDGADPRGGHAGRREGVKERATAAGILAMLALDRPDRINALHLLKAAANKGALVDAERSVTDLVQMRDDAGFAQVMAASGRLAEPEALIAARATAAQAARERDGREAEALAAGDRLRDHRGQAPQGWRRLLGSLTGANERHRMVEASLAATKSNLDATVSTAESAVRKARQGLETATRNHEAADRAYREGWRTEASFAPARIAAADAALTLLHQRPDLARLGPGGLLKAGYCIVDATVPTGPMSALEDDFGLSATVPGGP